jgi:hypothetical protein
VYLDADEPSCSALVEIQHEMKTYLKRLHCTFNNLYTFLGNKVARGPS